MTVGRLLNYPIILIGRTPGPDDSWGSPTMVDTRVSAVCYYRQLETSDNEALGNVTEQVEVFLAAGTDIGYVDAVELDLGRGYPEVLQVIGNPAPELNARLGTVNHLRLLTERGAP